MAACFAFFFFPAFFFFLADFFLPAAFLLPALFNDFFFFFEAFFFFFFFPPFFAFFFAIVISFQVCLTTEKPGDTARTIQPPAGVSPHRHADLGFESGPGPKPLHGPEGLDRAGWRLPRS